MFPGAQLWTYLMIKPMKDLEASIPALNWFATREGKGADAAPLELSSSSRSLRIFAAFLPLTEMRKQQ
jgi:hypothetical protein